VSGADVYEVAVREWVARQLRGRGHTQYTRDEVRNVRLGIDEGFHGSDVTPADEPEAAIACELRVSDRKVGHWTDAEGWQEHHEHVSSVAELVRECAAIVAELESAS
jgi:hypothetical protein